MKQSYKIFLTSILIVTFVVISCLLLFGTIAATEVGTPDCEHGKKSECSLREQKSICPNRHSSPCPLDATE